MSLATSAGAGAGMGGAGLSAAAMAHNNGPAAVAPSFQHRAVPPGATSSGYAATPGTSFAAVGADLLDKNQTFLNSKGVRGAARLPIVAVDLYGDDGDVAYFPPVEDEDDGDDEMATMMRHMDRMKQGSRVRSVECLGKGGDKGGVDLLLKRDDDAAQKAVRKYLTKGHGHGTVMDNAVCDVDEESLIVIPRPHLVMGCRRFAELSPATRERYGSLIPDAASDGNDDAATAMIDKETITSASPLALTVIAMDGNASPKGDDFDRIAFKMRLHHKKKIVTMLPEEALSIIVAGARREVRDKYLQENPQSELAMAEASDENGDGDDESTYMDYPPAFAIPGWAALDTSIEALIDAAGGSGASCGPSLHQRSIAAFIGAAAPSPITAGTQPTPQSKLTKLLMDTCKAKDDEAQQKAAREAALKRTGEDPVKPEDFVPLVLLVGATADGIEMTAVQPSKKQGPDSELHCPFGNVSVLASVCHRTNDFTGRIEDTLDEIRAQIGVLLPESEEPTAIVTYGTVAAQIALSKAMTATLTKYGEDGKEAGDDWDGWDQDMPILSTRPGTVATGLAVLAASAHGRVRTIVQVKGTDDKRRPKARAGVSVQDAATCAVAVSYNYRNGEVDAWTAPKVIFDFDRRVPAGPYRLEFTAAECAAHAAAAPKADCIEDEKELEEKARGFEGSGGIPQREVAALALRFRLLQRTLRGSDPDDWIPLGDVLRPLTMEHSQKDEGESGEDNLVACEASVLELSLSSVGLITTGLTTSGETIVQATKSARNSKIFKWVGIFGAIAFFGGFLVKSYVEERIFDRDTQRVLAYYKHAAKNSFHDGDERQARYLVWKYKGKKDALWRRLEAKYDVPVKHAWEWDDEDDETADSNEEDETEDLDGDDDGGEEKKADDGDEL